jgi:hypothetical protein
VYRRTGHVRSSITGSFVDAVPVDQSGQDLLCPGQVDDLAFDPIQFVGEAAG